MVPTFKFSVIYMLFAACIATPSYAGGQGGNNQNGQQGNNNQNGQGNNNQGQQQGNNQQGQNGAANAQAAGAQSQNYGGQQQSADNQSKSESQLTPPEAPEIKTPAVKGVDMSALIQPIPDVAIDSQAAMAYLGGVDRGVSSGGSSTAIAIGNDSNQSAQNSISFLNITSNNRAIFQTQPSNSSGGYVDFQMGSERAATEVRGRLFGNLETGDSRLGYSMGIVEGSTASRRFKSNEEGAPLRVEPVREFSETTVLSDTNVSSGGSLATGGHRSR